VVATVTREHETARGTRSLTRFDENIGALKLTLSADDIAELEIGSARIGVTGARYPEQSLKEVGL